MSAAGGRDGLTRTQLQDQITQLEELIASLTANSAGDQAKIANLETALVTSRRIGAAMGILMASQRVTEDQAFGLLRAASQDSHRKLRDIADDVVRTGTLDT